MVVEHTKTLFSSHHVDLPAGDVTPDQVRQAINEWLVKTFEREWRIAASAVDPMHVPHGPMDRFEPDEHDPDDPLTWLLPMLPPLSSPRFVGAGLCAAPKCTYLAYLHPYCAACCKHKFKVEVKRTTQQRGGLGLFATSTMMGRPNRMVELCQMHKVDESGGIVNFCTVAKQIDKEECTPPSEM